MATIASIVDSLHPSDGATAVILGDQVWVIFDQEIDETSVKQGNLFVTGPDTDTWSGPGLSIFRDKGGFSDNDDILASPGYTGIVQGAITFERINISNYGAYSGFDTSGAGNTYRTKAVFTPTNRLAASTAYNVFLSGDEDLTDSLAAGIKTRTVFDPIKGSNIGTGDATFTGGYTGSADDVVRLKITVTGDENAAQFQWWTDNNPDIISDDIDVSTSPVFIKDDIYVSFSNGTYVTDDTFSVVVKVGVTFTGNLVWSFTTGSGSIQTMPSTISTNIIGTPTSTAVTSSSSTLSILSTTPADLSANTAAKDIAAIVLNFSEELSASGITSETFKVTANDLEGAIISGYTEEENLVKAIVLDGTQVTLKL